MRSVLVTGGAGYIGSHACKALARAGYRPVVYDDLRRGHDWAVQWGPLEQGDLLDRERLDAVIAHYRPEAVMHFAGYAYVGESIGDPGAYYRNNTFGSLTLLEAMDNARTDIYRATLRGKGYSNKAIQEMIDGTRELPSATPAGSGAGARANLLHVAIDGLVAGRALLEFLRGCRVHRLVVAAFFLPVPATDMINVNNSSQACGWPPLDLASASTFAH